MCLNELRTAEEGRTGGRESAKISRHQVKNTRGVREAHLIRVNSIDGKDFTGECGGETLGNGIALNEGMINVILADHERIFRIGMASALAAEDDIRIVGQPSTPEQLVRGLASFRPHVLVVSSAFLECMDSVRKVCEQQHTAVLLLEDYGASRGPQLAAEFQGVIRRSADEGAVLSCIRHLARGGRVVRLARSNAPDWTTDPVGIRVRQRLTAYELMIVSHVVEGFKNREIAARVGTTEQSVKNSLRKIFDKTGVYGRLELALFVMHHRTLAVGLPTASPSPDVKVIPFENRQWPVVRQWSIH
jgi:DNA-binding NarL/FixJ family response regulator